MMTTESQTMSKAGKSKPKPPSGFVAFGSKRGGYRKPKPGGGWMYWYPDEHQSHHTIDWERDPTKGTGVAEVKPGHFVSVGGRSGLFVWTPDHAESDDQTTWVTPYDPAHKRAAGTPERVLTRNVQAMRSFDPEERKKKQKKRKKRKGGARAGTPPSRPRPPVRRPPPPPRSGRPAAPPPPKDVEGVAPGAEARMAEVFADSVAKEGTFLHKLENGGYMLAVYKDGHNARNRREWAVFVPKADQAGMLNEFAGAIHNAARTAAQTYRVALFDSTGAESAEFEEIKSGATMGFVLSLRSYAGGAPFSKRVKDYCNVYAVRAAREVLSGGGSPISHRQMQMVHHLIAAQARASTGGPATDKAIARAWYLPKSQTFQTGGDNLGVYADPGDPDKLINQSREQVPLDTWRLRGPDGQEYGKEYPGKLELIQTLMPILAGDRVKDSDWMNDNQDQVLPTMADSTLPQGSQLHLRAEIDAVLARMDANTAETLTVLFGLERGSESGGVSDIELATTLGLGKPTDSDRTLQRKGKTAREHAVNVYRNVAESMGAESAGKAKRWATASRHVPKVRSIDGFSHGQLREKYGTDERVYMYQTAQRAGEAGRVGPLLEKEKAGKLSKKQSESLRSWYYQQRREERQKQFQLYTKTYSVSPEEVKDTGPQTGTDPANDWLYTSEIMTGYMQSLLHPNTDLKALPRGKGQSRVMSEEKFLRFMGRTGRSRGAGQGSGDNSGGDNG